MPAAKRLWQWIRPQQFLWCPWVVESSARFAAAVIVDVVAFFSTLDISVLDIALGSNVSKLVDEEHSSPKGWHDFVRKDRTYSAITTTAELLNSDIDALTERWGRFQHEFGSLENFYIPSESAEDSADISDVTTDIDSSSTMSENMNMDQTRGLAVEKLMTEFKLLLDQHLGIRDCVDGTSSKYADGRESIEETQVKTSQRENENPFKRIQFLRKRAQAADDEGEEGEEEQPRKKRPDSAPVDDPKRKLACPFYRRNPERHKRHRSCAGPGWSTIHRLKWVATIRIYLLRRTN